MCRPILILGAFAVLFLATAFSQRVRIIYPTYRPPPQPRYPVIRTAREANHEPIQLNGYGDATHLPAAAERPIIYDDIKLEPTIRYVRSLSTPGRGRPSGSSSKSSRGHDTGPTHPGYNRRNAREATEEPKQGPVIYDDIKLDPTIRYARSLSTPGRGRASGTSSKSSRGHDTGSTHPGYNRRNTRSLNFPTLLPPFNPRPKPWNPPTFPIPVPERPRFPIYV